MVMDNRFKFLIQSQVKLMWFKNEERRRESMDVNLFAFCLFIRIFFGLLAPFISISMPNCLFLLNIISEGIIMH